MTNPETERPTEAAAEAEPELELEAESADEEEAGELHIEWAGFI